MGGDVGVAISSCIFLTGALQFGMRQSAEAENLMTSVERVMEYGDLPSEADLTNSESSNSPPFENGVIGSVHLIRLPSKTNFLKLKKTPFTTLFGIRPPSKAPL